MARYINFIDLEYNQVISTIKESLDRCNVLHWNTVQKNIWLKLVKDHIVQYNDMKKFFDMGQIFSDYFDKNNTAIPYIELVQQLTY